MSNDTTIHGYPPADEPIAAALDRFAKHIADEVARILRAELESPLEKRICDIDREIDRLRAELVALSESHAHALETT